MEIKFKVFFDVFISFAFKSANIEGGFVGVIFRKKDEFNYYALEINKTWVRFKKLFRGKVTIFAKEPLKK